VTGPGPPDESMPICRHHQRLKHLSLRHQRKHQHTHHQNNPQHYHTHHHHQLPTDLKGKCNNNPTATNATHAAVATTTSSSDSASASASAYASATTSARASASLHPPCHGSLNNLCSSATTQDEFDFVIPPGCACDECYVYAPTSLPSASASATCSTLVADECYSQTAASMLNAVSTVTAIAINNINSSTNAQKTKSTAEITAENTASVAEITAENAATAATSSASTLCSSAYFSTSAPTASSSSVQSMSRSNSKKLNNNNTCSLNNNNNHNNKLSFRSSCSSHLSQFQSPPLSPQQQKQLQSPKQHLQQLQLGSVMNSGGGGGGGAGEFTSSPPLQSPTEKFCETDLDDELDDDPKSPHSASSLSETFDWWFNKPKRNSKKCRYLYLHHQNSKIQH